MNILVIFTGGTIGSSVIDGYIAPEEDQRYKLIEDYRKFSPCPVVYQGVYAEHPHMQMSEALYIDTIKPYQILSENLNGDYINSLISCLKDSMTACTRVTRQDDASGTHTGYDGIIVTHGTDTLQYTAAALGYAFYDTCIPIVLVSSNYILDDKRANGLDNFYYAIEYIRLFTQKKTEPGVYVSYRNGEEHQLIHRAVRLLPHTPYDDLLYSVGDSFYGEFSTAGFIRHNTVSDIAANADDKSLSVSDSDVLSNPYTSALVSPAPVLYIRPVPGQSYPAVGTHIRAILLDTYHSGTLGTDSREFTNFIENATANSIPVFLTGAENRTGYESTRVYKPLGIHVLPKASPIAMYMKLWFLTSHFQDKAYNMQQLVTDMETACGWDFVQ